MPPLTLRTSHARQTHRSLKHRTAFTLVELLVAMSILTMLMVLVGQIIGMASQSTTLNTKRLDGMGQARMALDWIGFDITARLKRTDVPHGCNKVHGNGNDLLGFYSEVDAYSGNRKVAAVGYRILEPSPSGGDPFQLQRGVEGTDWQLTGGIRFSQPFPTIDNVDYEVLADSILRIEFCYLKTDGTLSNFAAADLSDVSAIVVALAVLDSTTRKITSEGNLNALAKSLPDSAEGHDPISAWHAAYATSGFATGAPRPAIEALRFAQRYFYVR